VKYTIALVIEDFIIKKYVNGNKNHKISIFVANAFL